MTAIDLEGAKLENDLYLAILVKRIYTRWRVGRPEKIGDHDADVLNGSAEGLAPVRLYFDPQTGLLLRVIHYTVTPLGRLPAQVDFADYRDQDDVKVPYRMTMTQRNSSITVQFDQVRQNGSVEDSKFLKPASPRRP